MMGKNSAKLTSLENELLEYKRAVDRDTLRREIVAFANTQGGKIMIGVADDGIVAGVNGLTADDVSNMVRSGCVPPLAPKIDRKYHDGKEVIIVTVSPGQDRPYRTNGGTYYIRVGAIVRIPSISELIDLIVKGSHRDTILLKARLPQLQAQISACMSANAGIDQALINIAELSDMAMKARDESTKMEITIMVGRLLEISCSDDRVIQRLLLLLAEVSSVNLAQNPHLTRPNQELFEQIIEIIKQAFFRTTIVPKVTDQTKYVLAVLYMVGLGCAWGNHTDQFIKVTEIINSHRDRDRKLTKLCEDTLNRLIRNVKEVAYPPRRMGMLLEPFLS